MPKKILYHACRFIIRSAAKSIWRLTILGAEHVPMKGAVIIAANHRSFGDPPLVGAAMLREVHFLAKEELFRFKPFGWLIRNLNAHPLNRLRDIAAFKTAQRLLADGEALIVFPEGRRSKSDDLAKGKPGVGMIAKKTRSIVLPTYIHNSGHLRSFWKVTVVFGKPFHPDMFDSYQAIADEVMRRIQRLKDAVER